MSGVFDPDPGVGIKGNPMITGHETGAKGIGYRIFDPLGLTKDWTKEVRPTTTPAVDFTGQARQYEANRSRYRGAMALGG